MDGPNTLKGWNELLDYLQTNNAFRKSKFINYKFDDSTLLLPLSTIQQDVLNYLNEFIALQFVRGEYYKELALTRKICGILSKKLQKLALLKL